MGKRDNLSLPGLFRRQAFRGGIWCAAPGTTIFLSDHRVSVAQVRAHYKGGGWTATDGHGPTRTEVNEMCGVDMVDETDDADPVDAVTGEVFALRSFRVAVSLRAPAARWKVAPGSNPGASFLPGHLSLAGTAESKTRGNGSYTSVRNQELPRESTSPCMVIRL